MKTPSLILKISIATITAALSITCFVSTIASALAGTSTAFIDLNVESVLSLSGATDTVILSGPSNTTLTSVQTLNVTTNNTGGYFLQFEVNDASATLFNALDTAKTCSVAYKCVPATNNGLASATGTLEDINPTNAKALQNNTWGYNFSNTNNTPANTFFTAPSQSSPQVINSKSAAAANDPTHVTFAARPTKDFPSGTYQNSVLYTAVSIDLPAPEPEPEPIIQSTMQAFAVADCAVLNIGDIVHLKDIRNDQRYRVKKMPDNNCWMIDNLKLADFKLTAENSQIDAWSSVTLPPPNTDNPSDIYKVYDPGPSTICNLGAQNAVYNASSPTGCGYLYDFETAIAGSTMFSFGGGGGFSLTKVTTGSICPKNWRLPKTETVIGDPNNEVDQLNAKMSGFSSNQDAAYQSNARKDGEAVWFEGDYLKPWLPSGAWQGTRSGLYETGFAKQGNEGFFWSSSPSPANGYAYGFNQSGIYSAKEYNYGQFLAVRCLVPSQ